MQACYATRGQVIVLAWLLCGATASDFMCEYLRSVCLNDVLERFFIVVLLFVE